MKDPISSDSLAGLPAFHLLTRDLLDRVAACSRPRRLEAGEILFQEGDPCRAFYAIRLGRMRLYRATLDGREQVVHQLGAGQTFAEAALLSFGRFPASASAMETPTELVEIGGEPFLRLFREDDRLAAAMIGSLSMRLLSLVERVEELSLVHAGSRLARYLLRQPARGPSDRPTVELAMPKKDLAAHLSMTPETLSRLLRRWQDQGWAESERGGITLLDPARLLRMADGEAEAPGP
jgi:CRP/FNR family transcriptional regulator